MTILYILLGLIGLILILSAIAPKTYEVHRSVVIQRPMTEVFDYVKFIRNQDHWSPWKKKDPNMKQESVGTDGEVGFISKWQGNKEVGIGEQEIKRIVDNEIIESELRFLKPWKSVSNAYLKVNQIENDQTEVIWGFNGVNPVPFNIFMLFFNFEKTVGKDFEDGLSSLKEILEP